MQNYSIKEITRTPKLILMLFFFQLIGVLILFIYKKEWDFGIFYILLPVTFLLAVSFLKVTFNKYGIAYQLFPIHLKNRDIAFDQMDSIQIIKIDALSDFLGWGLRYSKRYGTGYILGNEYALFITLKTGRKITLTIKDKSKIADFLRHNNIEFLEAS